MSQIEELIQQHCPDGVEFKELGEVCDFRNGFAFKSSRFKTVGSPIIRIGNIQNRIVDLSNLVFFDIEEYRENLTPFEIKKGDVLIAMSGATTGKIGFLNSDEVFYLNQRVGKFEPHINELENRFLYHYLLTKNNELYVLAGGGAQPNLSSTALMKKITIPVPPLSIQQEIVSILDKFTQLEADLEAELEARRAQYNFYRNQLLNFEGKEVEWKTLGEVCEITTGQKPNEIFEVGKLEYSYINAGLEPSGSLGLTNATGQTITIPSRGQGGAGYVGFQIKDFWCGPLCYKIKSNKPFLNTKYLFYYLKIIQEKIIGLRKIGSIPAVNKEDLKTIIVKIPRITEQERIVGILDKFDALVNDISVGLPAEIAARRKQYEYYREKLLNFKPLNN